MINIAKAYLPTGNCFSRVCVCVCVCARARVRIRAAVHDVCVHICTSCAVILLMTLSFDDEVDCELWINNRQHGRVERQIIVDLINYNRNYMAISSEREVWSLCIICAIKRRQTSHKLPRNLDGHDDCYAVMGIVNLFWHFTDPHKFNRI
jgi:hypothetical protein